MNRLSIICLSLALLFSSACNQVITATEKDKETVTKVNAETKEKSNNEQSKSEIIPKTYEKTIEADYLGELEINIINEMNLARNNPKEYAETTIKKIISYYDGKLLRFPGDIPIETREGVKAAQEAYDLLINMEGIGELKASQGLSKSAADLVKMQENTELTGHKGSDGSTPSERMQRYGQWLGSAAENIEYGNNNAEKIIASLIIDDGVESRGHRKNIFEKNFNYVGVATGSHKTYNYMSVMDFATVFKEE